ncbi:TPA: hypothetical protein J1460_003767 [Escherichia coli]|nr:hypothetical protein [Escherichia coli]
MSPQHKNNVDGGNALTRTAITSKNCSSTFHTGIKKNDIRFYQWVAGLLIATLLIVCGLWFTGLLDISGKPFR